MRTNYSNVKYTSGYTPNGKPSKRIGANRQMVINARKARFNEVLESKAVVYTSYALMSAFVLGGVYMMFVMAVLFDPSNPYN